MSKLRSHLLVAGLISCASFAALAQTAPTPPAPGGPGAKPPVHQRGERMGRHDPAKFAERMAKRQAELKAKLKITPAQEGAWSTFTSATQPPARPAQRPDRAAARAEFEKMTTPQRIDRMQARQAERAAMFAKRADATKTFYAVLTPEQQKTFDAQAMRHGPRDGHGPHGHRAPPPAKG